MVFESKLTADDIRRRLSSLTLKYNWVNKYRTVNQFVAKWNAHYFYLLHTNGLLVVKQMNPFIGKVTPYKSGSIIRGKFQPAKNERIVLTIILVIYYLSVLYICILNNDYSFISILMLLIIVTIFLSLVLLIPHCINKITQTSHTHDKCINDANMQ